MLKIVAVKIEDIYVPTARRKELTESKLDETSEQLLNGNSLKPIKVREGKGRFVLVKGVHRLEASKALGETEINAYIVQAPKF